MKIEPQHFRTIELAELPDVARTYKDHGYRFVQCFAVRIGEDCEVTYSFEKDLVLENVQFMVPKGTGFASVSPLFTAAFVFENEMHDLFGIEISDIVIDFKGKFYTLSTPTPMVSDTESN